MCIASLAPGHEQGADVPCDTGASITVRSGAARVSLREAAGLHGRSNQVIPSESVRVSGAVCGVRLASMAVD